MDILSKPAEEFTNDPTVELFWAQKAIQRAEIYLNIIKSGNVADLKLTAYDDEIYEKFRKDFADFNVELVDEEVLKSDIGKEKWRCFCEHFRHIEDYNEGTLMRSDAKCTENGPDSCILVLRIQFLAIEIARNREGLNVFS